ncbi:BTB domain-containing protein [Psidium guajava]|nr:BTB domain-containing protein [Psidium guajava]
MADSKVETLSRLAQWRIDNFGPSSYRKSEPFKMGIWNWHLSVERNRHLYVRLFPELSRISKEQPPLARFVVRVSVAGTGRKLFTSQVYDRLLRTCDDFGWSVDCAFHGRFTIDVEFLDLKICSLNGGEPTPVWLGDGSGSVQSVATQRTLHCLSRMLEEAIHSDITINTSDGSLRAHKAILSTSSPVFQSMFHHNLKEKESSTIFIEDMSLESCTALLSYLYGCIKQEDFWKHRLALLGAANKYGIAALKDACEDSLLEDISSSNVLERLQEAWLYQLDKLKKGCLMFLFEFGKVYDVREEMNNFFRQADRELMLEMFQEVLTAWKPT